MLFGQLEKDITQGQEAFGENLARTQRILAKVFFDWAQGRANPYLTPIYFDKLAEFVCRILDRLKQQGLVRHRSGFQRRRGIHGSGRALQMRRGTDDDLDGRTRWAYMTEIVEGLQTAPLGNAKALFARTSDARDMKCRISSAIDGSQWHVWNCATEAQSKFLETNEIVLVEDMGRAVLGLDPEGIRAIGTHCAAEDTLRDIEYNLGYWESGLDSVEKSLAAGDPRVALPTWRRVINASKEIVRKSETNREDYEKARAQALAGCMLPELRAAIEAVQPPASRIWDVRVQERTVPARLLVQLSSIVEGGLSGNAASVVVSELEGLAKAHPLYIPRSPATAGAPTPADWLAHVRLIWHALESRFHRLDLRPAVIP